MSLVDTINNELKTAMKAGDKERLSTLRMLVSALRYAQIDQGELSDEQVIVVLQKEAKKRKESIEAYKAAERAEAQQAEERELAIIQQFVPSMMSQEEVEAEVERILNSAKFDNLGLAIGAVMKELKGKAEGSVVSAVVKEKYSA